MVGPTQCWGRGGMVSEYQWDEEFHGIPGLCVAECVEASLRLPGTHELSREGSLSGASALSEEVPELWAWSAGQEAAPVWLESFNDGVHT